MSNRDDQDWQKVFEEAGARVDGESCAGPACDEEVFDTVQTHLRHQREVVHRAVEETPVPDGVHQAVHRLVAAGVRPAQRPWLPGMGWAVAAGLLLVVTWQGGQLKEARHQQVTMAEFVQEHQKFAGRSDLMQLSTSDPTEAVAWLSKKLTFPPRMPTKVNATLKGVRTCGLLGNNMGLLLYDQNGAALTVYISNNEKLKLPALDTANLQVKTWQEGDITFIAIKGMPRQIQESVEQL